jgi:two-component system, cell cycle response regulator
MAGDEQFEDEKTVIGDRMLLAVEGTNEKQAYLRVLTGPTPGQLFRVADGGALGRGTNVTFHIPDSQISRRHAHLFVDGDEFTVKDLDSTNGTYVNGERVVTRRLADGDTIRLGHTTALKLTLLSEIDGELQKQMFESALRDGLTKAYNKRFFETRLDEEVAYALRQDARLALLMFDLDHFKHVNDTYGHLAGDFVLAEIGTLVTATSRREDIFARIGGEEFAVIARGLTRAQALEFAERLRRAIHEHSFVHEGTVLPVTASLGVACVPDTPVNSATALSAAADAALYRAKTSGRNRVESA